MKLELTDDIASFGASWPESNDTFSIFLHDKNYFHVSMNPIASPGVRMLHSKNFLAVQKIVIIKQVKRTTEENPCKENHDYRLQHCVRQYVENKIGCKMPWTTIEYKERMNNCIRMKDYKLFEDYYHRLVDLDIKDLTAKTGCKPPCTYKEVKTVGEIFPINNKQFYKYSDGYLLSLASTNVQVETEVRLYTFVNLVGDIGGSLGLFLGFSFFMMWDLLMFLIEFIKNKNIKNRLINL